MQDPNTNTNPTINPNNPNTTNPTDNSHNTKDSKPSSPPDYLELDIDKIREFMYYINLISYIFNNISILVAF